MFCDLGPFLVPGTSCRRAHSDYPVSWVQYGLDLAGAGSSEDGQRCPPLRMAVNALCRLRYNSVPSLIPHVGLELFF